MKNTLFKLFVVSVFMLIPNLINAQTIRVAGSVVDNKNVPLMGASVAVKGTTMGTIVDMDGKFSLDNVPQGATLVASYLGYTSVSLPAAATVNFILKEDVNLLDDVVVVGYGTQKRSDIAGAVSSVDVSELPKAASASVGNMLRGRAAGMEITSQSAAPGAALNISIRGGLSGAAPLVVIDGVPQAGSTFAGSASSFNGVNKEGTLINLNPNDIESIDILKDASAAAIYGSDASGGVILITTKRGKQGKVNVSYSGSVALSYMSDVPEVLNAKDFMIESNKIMSELGRYSERKFSQEQIDNFVGNGTDWLKEVTRTGVVTEHNATITSGNEFTQGLMSLSYYNNEGIAKNNSMNRITGRLNLDQKISKHVKVGLSSTFTQIKYRDVPLNSDYMETSIIYSALTYLPTVPVMDENGNYSENPYRNLYTNPVSLLEVSDNTTNQDLSINGYIEYRPFKDLLIKAVAGVDYKDSQHDQYIPRTVREGYNKDGIGSKYNSKNVMQVVNAFAQYSHNWNETHDFSAMLGWEFKQNSWEGQGASGEDFPFDTPLYNNLGSSGETNRFISSYKNKNQMASFFGRFNYMLKNKYIITANFRIDGSSNFSENHQWGFFPGMSLAWKMNEESWLKDINWLNSLKIRAGIGQTGNAGYLNGTIKTYGTGPAFAPGGTYVNGIFVSKLANPNLKWETLTDYSLGIDFGFFNNRISGSIDLYQRNRSDVIAEKNLLSYQPEPTKVNYNFGDVYRSRGVDISLHTVNISTRDFSWNTDINFSFYRNKTVKRDKDFVPAIYQDWIETWGDIWVYKSDGLIQPDEIVPHQPGALAGAIKIKDIGGYVYDDNGIQLRDKEGRYINSGEGDGKLDMADYYKLANNTPIPFSINNTVTWKNWDLNVYFYGSLNGWKMNDILTQAIYGYEQVGIYGINALAAIKDRWSEDNPDGTLPGIQQIFANGGVNHTQSDYFYEKAWYLRLDNVSLGYNFSTKLFKDKIQQLRIYVSGRNLAVITPYTGMDPETGNGKAPYPNTRSFAVGIDFKF